MSDRYEVTAAAHCDIRLVAPGTRLGYDHLEEGDYGLVIGVPSAAAHVVTGDLGSLARFARRALDLVHDHVRPSTAESPTANQAPAPQRAGSEPGQSQGPSVWPAAAIEKALSALNEGRPAHTCWYAAPQSPTAIAQKRGQRARIIFELLTDDCARDHGLLAD